MLVVNLFTDNNEHQQTVIVNHPGMENIHFQREFCRFLEEVKAESEEWRQILHPDSVEVSY